MRSLRLSTLIVSAASMVCAAPLFAQSDAGRSLPTIAFEQNVPVAEGAAVVEARGYARGSRSAGPAIEVSDHAFGAVGVGGRSLAISVEIRNTASDGSPLSVIGLTGPAPSAFSLAAGAPLLPMTIPAGESRTLPVIFRPTEAAPYQGEIVVHSNAVGGDSVALLSGTGAAMSLTATSYDWGRRRVGHQYEGTVTLKNTATSDVEGLSFRFEGDTSEFKVLDPAFSGTALRAGDSLVLDVLFKPSGVGLKQMKIIYNGTPAGASEVASVIGGFATKPELITADCDFGTATIGDPEGRKKIFFFAPETETFDSVTITGFRFESDSAGGAADFRYEPLEPLSFPIVLKAGQSIEAAVFFQPRATGTRRAMLTALTLDSVDLTSYWKGVGADISSSVMFGREEITGGARILPNPAAGTSVRLQYEVPAQGPVTIDLLDPRGSLVRTFADAPITRPGEQATRLDLSAIPSGTYFVRIRLAGRTIVEPLVIAR